MRIIKTLIWLIVVIGFCPHSSIAQFINRGKIISITDGSVVAIQGDVINQGAIRNEGTLLVSGDWTNINSYLSQNGRFVLNGVTVQQVDNNGQTFYTLELAGGGRKVFNSDIEVVNELILVAGIAEITARRTFLLREGAFITGGSEQSYVEGRLYQTGSGDFDYPVGANGVYAPIKLLDVTGNEPVTGIEVFESSPRAIAGFGLTSVSEERYWERSLMSGTFDGARVEISIINESSIEDINKVVVAGGDNLGGNFVSLGQQAITGDETNGTVESDESTNSLIYAIGRELNESRLADSLSLVAIFNATGGASNWTSAANWLVSSIDNWQGVGIDPTTERVTRIELPNNGLIGELPSLIRSLNAVTFMDLSGNSLSGAIPSQITQMTSLTDLNLSNNDISTLPDLSTLVNAQINVANNQLRFSSLEPNVSIANFTFAPQDSLGVGGFFLFDRGQDFTLSLDEDSPNDLYQWFLNDEPLVGEINSTIDILDLNRSNMGEYRCEVTNRIVTDFSLHNRLTSLFATGDIGGSLFVSEDESLTAGSITLLKVRSDGPYDTISVKPLLPTGVYNFENVILGDYVVITEPFDLDRFLPTYHENSIQWDLANVIPLNDDTTGIDIRVQEIPVPFTPEDGNGAIGGEIFSDFPDEEGGRIQARRRVRRVGCALRRRRSQGRTDEEDEDFPLVAYTMTDDEGRFTFQNLPVGLYRLFIEYPGIPINPDSFTEFEIGEDVDQNGFTVAATVFEDGIEIDLVKETGIPYDYIQDLSIYPNPAGDGNLYVSVNARRGYEINFALVDLSGLTVLSERLDSFNLGNGTRQFDISNLSNGIYLIKITVPEFQNQLFRVGKVIIK